MLRTKLPLLIKISIFFTLICENTLQASQAQTTESSIPKIVHELVEAFLKERENKQQMPLRSDAAGDQKILEPLITRLVTVISDNYEDRTKLQVLASFESGDLANEYLVLQALHALGFTALTHIILVDRFYQPRVLLPGKIIQPHAIESLSLVSEKIANEKLALVNTFEKRMRTLFPKVQISTYQLIEQYSLACTDKTVPKADPILWINPQLVKIEGKEKKELDQKIEEIKKKNTALAPLDFTQPSEANAAKDALIVEAKFTYVIPYYLPAPSREKILLPLFKYGSNLEFTLAQLQSTQTLTKPQEEELQKTAQSLIKAYGKHRIELITQLGHGSPNFKLLYRDFLEKQCLPVRKQLETALKERKSAQAQEQKE